MAILTNSGRVAMAVAVKAQPIHLAWGAGDVLWDTVPAVENIADAALLSEIGRRTVAYTAFCQPDVAGAIIVPTGRFAETLTPTKNLYMRFAFDFTDAPVSTVRELGVFVGSAIQAGLPAGQMYFTPAQLTSSGYLLLLEHIQKFVRSPSVRQTFEFVVTF